MTKRAVILAAGLGSRLVHGRSYPKPLHPVAGVPLIVRILRKLERHGVEEVGIIVGYQGDAIRSALAYYRFSPKLRFIQNDEWEKPNGTSLLKADSFVTERSFVLMSDHLFSPDLLDTVGGVALRDDEIALGVDYNIARCFDLDDATKVSVQAGRVQNIGKELGSYDALDTGVFCITPALMQALKEVDGPQGCSLSQGVSQLAAKGRMHAVDVGNASWIDVDTPEAYAEAERTLARYEGASLGREVFAPQPGAPAFGWLPANA